MVRTPMGGTGDSTREEADALLRITATRLGIIWLGNDLPAGSHELSVFDSRRYGWIQKGH